ncbi:expressed unknown protein [Seminavis robusta]|uniref:Uncharacterized protein n=1 Tax=Seminavis robusta TaxID=568900 RepID=A0A9N8HR05_9STRA|nr:expressed unknown protein [Seminavis robusta]|eukprot:Sro1261_g257021.1  (133) ;mRNA; f:14826-15224
MLFRTKTVGWKSSRILVIHCVLTSVLTFTCRSVTRKLRSSSRRLPPIRRRRNTRNISPTTQSTRTSTRIGTFGSVRRVVHPITILATTPYPRWPSNSARSLESQILRSSRIMVFVPMESPRCIKLAFRWRLD